MPVPPSPPPDYAAIFGAAPGKYLLLAPDLTIIGVTDAYLASTMTSRDAILGRGLFEVFPDNPDTPSADGVRNLRASLMRVLAHRTADRMPMQKYDIRRPEAAGGGFEERYWSPVNTPVLDAYGKVQCIIHCVEDVTEFIRLKHEMQQEQEALQEELRARAGKIEAETYLRVEAVEASRRLADSERRYRFLTDAVPQLLWTADPAGALDYCNRRCLEFTNLPFDALKGDGWLGILHPDDREPTATAWSEAVRTGAGQYRIEHRMRHRDGGWRWMLTSALPFRDGRGTIRKWFGTSTDIHDRVLADAQLRQAQRLHAAGKLAGGMAHEVNNMMTAVLGFGGLALTALGHDHPQRRDVEEMIKAGNRAAEVSRQLLAFSRQQVLRPVVLDVNAVITELVPALERLLGADRRLEVIATRSPVRVVADRGQVEQVLINLVANARDATATDGVVIVETSTVVVDASGPGEPGVGELEPGRFVRLAVRDNGRGMAPDTAARAFEPFFTTKGVGQGTGLGLSMVYGIVKQSGGFARIESAERVGTAVRIYLPLVDATVAAPPPTEAAPRGRNETILVVEDEVIVRSVAFTALRNAGYVVFQAPNGSAALKFLEGHPGQVDLVLTDIVMPRMNGRELAEAIWARHPGLPILFMSGYSDDEVIRRGVTLAGANFIAKPFTIHALATAVRAQLNRARQAVGSRRDPADAGPA